MGREVVLLIVFVILSSLTDAKLLPFKTTNVRRNQLEEVNHPRAATDIQFTTFILIREDFDTRIKRSRLTDRIRDAGKYLKDRIAGRKEKKVIHIPALFVEPESDGFQNVFYEEMINAALCLTSRPESDLHELVDEYEAVLCNKKGYGRIIEVTPSSSTSPPLLNRSKRDDENNNTEDYHEHNAEDAKWHMNKTHYDTLWKSEQNGSSTPHPLAVDDEDSADYDYSADPEINNQTGWESDDVVEDPSDLDYMKWPQFLPDGIVDNDEFRRKFHFHKENFTLEYIKTNLLLNQPEVQFEKRLFALNDSNYLGNYYEYILKVSPYNMKPIITKFFSKRQQTLNSFIQTKLTADTLRQLYILFTIDVHHVNCFNRHIRFYGYIMKKPSSINGDEITNDARLARGIIMRSLELIRHVPQYNAHKDFLLRFLIAALKERASLSKHLTTLIGENDYTELYEVASYLDSMLRNGIHPDEVNQDLFVQETRFYSHHFMNTLTL